MRRFTFKSVFALGLACLSAGVLPSCATNDSMMFIFGVYFRKQGACVPKADLDSPILAKGVLDREFAGEYRAALLVGNQITARGSRERLRTETSRVVLKGAEVTLESLDGKQLQDPFSSIGTGFVDSSEGTDPGLAILYATLIPGKAVAALPNGTLVAKVRAFGTTLGGQDVESGELAFPIEICSGCLITYPASARDLTADGGGYQCKQAADDSMAAADEVDLPCSLGTDVPSPCTACSGVSNVCLSPANNCYYTPDGPNCP